MVKHMAETGDGTNECLKLGCLPMRVHFYSPVPDIEDLRRRNIWNTRSRLSGIELREQQQLELLNELGLAFGNECVWAHDYDGDDTKFYTNNSGFSFGCAAALHGIIRKVQPRRVIEIGSGSSSRVISAALSLNAASGIPSAEYDVVDPYPMDALLKVPGISKVSRARVEEVPVEFFSKLEAGDILFVDSGHTVRIGGDVNFLILDVLPTLKSGVIIHFHDIPLPYEYAQVYFTNPRFRMFWTEAYLLQAFLAHNSKFEIMLAMNFLMRDHRSEFQKAWSHYNPIIHRDDSHSFWIRRRDD
jgi:hypothetical protein